jgi:hypothetical protein
MPPRKFGPNPGAVTGLCQCGARRMLSQATCNPCWKTLPLRLRQAWLAARDGDCDSGPALEAAAEAIREHLRAGVR